jgi:hypothetical protein
MSRESLFIITDNTKTSMGEVTGVSVMKDEDLQIEEIEVTIGGYRRCRCYSSVRYTIVNRSRESVTVR